MHCCFYVWLLFCLQVGFISATNLSFSSCVDAPSTSVNFTNISLTPLTNDDSNDPFWERWSASQKATLSLHLTTPTLLPNDTRLIITSVILSRVVQSVETPLCQVSACPVEAGNFTINVSNWTVIYANIPGFDLTIQIALTSTSPLLGNNTITSNSTLTPALNNTIPVLNITRLAQNLETLLTSIRIPRQLVITFPANSALSLTEVTTNNLLACATVQYDNVIPSYARTIRYAGIVILILAIVLGWSVRSRQTRVTNRVAFDDEEFALPLGRLASNEQGSRHWKRLQRLVTPTGYDVLSWCQFVVCTGLMPIDMPTFYKSLTRQFSWTLMLYEPSNWYRENILNPVMNWIDLQDSSAKSLVPYRNGYMDYVSQLNIEPSALFPHIFINGVGFFALLLISIILFRLFMVFCCCCSLRTHHRRVSSSNTWRRLYQYYDAYGLSFLVRYLNYTFLAWTLTCLAQLSLSSPSWLSLLVAVMMLVIVLGGMTLLLYRIAVLYDAASLFERIPLRIVFGSLYEQFTPWTFRFAIATFVQVSIRSVALSGLIPFPLIAVALVAIMEWSFLMALLFRRPFAKPADNGIQIILALGRTSIMAILLCLVDRNVIDLPPADATMRSAPDAFVTDNVTRQYLTYAICAIHVIIWLMFVVLLLIVIVRSLLKSCCCCFETNKKRKPRFGVGDESIHLPHDLQHIDSWDSIPASNAASVHLEPVTALPIRPLSASLRERQRNSDSTYDAYINSTTAHSSVYAPSAPPVPFTLENAPSMGRYVTPLEPRFPPPAYSPYPCSSPERPLSSNQSPSSYILAPFS